MKGADIRIIGAIDEENYRKFCDDLDSLETDNSKGTIVVLAITTEGGSAYAALAVIERMRLSHLRINTTGVGFVASAGTLILAAGKHRAITRESWVMVHEDVDTCEGSVSQLENAIKHKRTLEHQWNRLLEQYTHGKTSAKKWEKIHAEGDVYLSPEECVQLGLVDKII